MHLSKLALSSIASSSFIERAFGPLDYGNPLVVQGGNPPNDFERGRADIPSKDFIDDLTDGPLYAGIATFAHLPLQDCYSDDAKFDIAVVGAPFDTGVTYRPGSRFGPGAIRDASRRLSPHQYSAFDNMDPFEYNQVAECGDVGMTPHDNRLALDKLYRAHRNLLKHKSETTDIPRVVTLGGDHTITFSAIRAAAEAHDEKISVIHFDSHLDTWDPLVLGGNISSYAQLNHGTFLHYAHEMGYLNDDGNLHVGSRAPYVRKHEDVENDHRCGFESVLVREIDSIGIQGVIDKIKQRVGDNKVYISLDIDVLDPAYAPGTGTSEPGGFTTRELLTILDGLKSLNVIGADVVEVSPPYDTNSALTSLAAAEVVNSFLHIMA